MRDSGQEGNRQGRQGAKAAKNKWLEMAEKTNRE